jgi:hypothetical protein
VFDPILPEPLAAAACRVQITSDGIIILARTTSLAAACPVCGCASSRVHSHYTRTLADLPWHGRAVRLVLTVRRFFCDAAGCCRTIFTERLPAVASAHARQTGRLVQALTGIGFACACSWDWSASPTAIATPRLSKPVEWLGPTPLIACATSATCSSVRPRPRSSSSLSRSTRSSAVCPTTERWCIPLLRRFMYEDDVFRVRALAGERWGLLAPRPLGFFPSGEHQEVPR